MQSRKTTTMTAETRCGSMAEAQARYSYGQATIRKIAEDAGIEAIKRPTQYADESVPFGMFLEYCIGLDIRKTLLISFAFTAFIEIGQLTGLFFMFKGSYRLFDVDDLMCNTLGALVGYFMIRRAESRFIPSIKTYDRFVGSDGVIVLGCDK